MFFCIIVIIIFHKSHNNYKLFNLMFQVANLREFEELNFDNYYLYQNALRYSEIEGIACRYVVF